MTVLIGTRAGLFDPGGRCLLESIHINHVARAGEGWWAVDDDGGVWRGADHIAASDAMLHCIQPTADDIWVGANRARLFHITGDRITEDQRFAEAPGREHWHTPWGGPPDVRSLAFGPDEVLYVNVHVGGILRYEDDGIFPTLDIGADVHQVVADPDRGGVVLAATAWGLAQSRNGRDFEFRTEGLAHHYCRAVATAGETLLLSASRGPRGGDSGVYRSSMSGGAFERCRIGLPADFESNVDTHHLLARGNEFFVGHDTTVWKSGDEGASWAQARTGLPPITCLA